MNIWMHQKEVDMILKYIENGSDKIMLEWGSGGSTSIFSKKVKNYYSIEHNLDWYYEVRKALVDEGVDNVVQYLQDCPKGRQEVYLEFYDKWEELILQISEESTNNYQNIAEFPSPKEMYVWYDYVNSIDKLGEKYYDFVLIDGRSRINCAHKILDYVDRDSVVFIHDFFNRPFYDPILENFEEIDSVKDTEQTIVVLRKK